MKIHSCEVHFPKEIVQLVSHFLFTEGIFVIQEMKWGESTLKCLKNRWRLEVLRHKEGDKSEVFGLKTLSESEMDQ